jgi:hypothetical protein
MGWQFVPTITLAGLTEAQRRAYVIADNQLALNAGWNYETLRMEMDALRNMDFNLDLIGFDAKFMAELFNPPGGGLTDPDETPDIPTEPVSKLGDVWLLGKHRLVCGDCTDADAVAKALNGVTPHLMVTDPPYGVEYDANWRNEKDRANGKPDGARAVGKVKNDDRADWREAWALFPGDVAYVWHADLCAKEVVESLEVCGFAMRTQIIWAKQQFVIGRGDYHVQHEPCWYAVRKGKTGHYGGGGNNPPSGRSTSR